MPTKIFKTSAIILFLICVACRTKHSGIPPAVGQGSDSSQIKSSSASFFPCKGNLVIPAADIVLVTLPSNGLLKSVQFQAGCFVKKGQILATIENIEFLKLQQLYLEAKSELFFFGEDLKRQGGLAVENATSVKRMQQAQRDYQTSEIRCRSLEKQLALIGFNTDSLDADRLSSTIDLRAPVSAYVDKIALHAGSQISAGETIFVLVRKYEPVISFELPEKFYPQLKTGKEIVFFFPGDSLDFYKARLTFINRQADVSNHLIKAWAVPLKSAPRLVPGMEVSMRLPL